MVFQDSQRRRSFNWIIPIVSSIAHPSLETVAITIFLDHVQKRDHVQEEIDALELSTLDSLFMKPPLSNNSTKLYFFIRGIDDREAVRAALKDGLPKLDGMKRIRIDSI
jgi:hypothetical protein